MSIVAIVSGIHCHGEEVAANVAERLGYELVGEDLLEKTAERFDTSVKKLYRVFSGSRSLLDGITHEQQKSLIQLKAAVADLTSHAGVVFLGWAAHLIPREISHVLRVVLVADRDYRTGVATETTDLDADTAMSLIKKSDQELADWTHRIHGAGPWEAELYDLKVPMQSVTLSEAVDLVCESVDSEALRPTDRSMRAVQDFQLATSVNLALLDRGHPYCDATAERGNVLVHIRRKPSSWGQLGRTIQNLRVEQLEQDVTEIASAVQGVESVEVLPGTWHRRRAGTLLVDDEQEYVMTLSERLEMRDIPSDIAHDGLQALEFVKTDAPDVMVLDLRMPGMDGLEVLERVRRDHPHVQVIVVTGHGSEQDERRARELGAFEYLEKPVNITVLAETIKRASAHGKQTTPSDGEPESEAGEP